MDISTKQLRQNTEKSCQKRWGCEIAGSAEGTTQKDTKNKCYCIARIYIPSVSRFHGLCEKLLKTTTYPPNPPKAASRTRQAEKGPLLHVFQGSQDLLLPRG
ncbi:unnamed protein product [Caretta caretta]